MLSVWSWDQGVKLDKIPYTKWDQKQVSSFIFGRVMGIWRCRYYWNSWFWEKCILSFEISILLSSYHLEFLAGNGWKCSILIWNQLFLKEEGPFFTFPSKSHFRYFWLFFIFWPISPFLWSTTWYLFIRTHTYYFPLSEQKLILEIKL